MPIRDLSIDPNLPPELAELVATLQNGTREWRRELGEVNDEEIGWQAAPGGHSIGALILHIADVETSWIEEVGLGRTPDPEETKELLSEETQQYESIWPLAPRRSLEYFLGVHDRIRARTLQAILEYRDLESQITTPWGAVVTKRWILAHVIAHESYHGGQAVLLKALRPKLTKE